jgi:peptidyl-prolyl cis-trans isomerase A (cyclophilin A)
MPRVPSRLTLLFCATSLLAACQPANDTDEPQAAAPAVEEAAASAIEQLVPLPGLEATAPVLTTATRVTLQTTQGDVVIDVYPEAAPNAAARFIELVQSGFYDETPISRVVPGFVAQFGINWREGHSDWQERNFDDDPTLFALERGTLAFAKAGPNTNSTQVFINYQENSHLASPQYNFTVFGKVVSGMEVVDSFLQVGDPGGGLDQGRLWVDGEAYLASLPAQPSMILQARLESATP